MKKQQEKRIASEEKDAQKARKLEEKRAAAEQKRKSVEVHRAEESAANTHVAAATAPEREDEQPIASALAAPLDADTDAAMHKASETDNDDPFVSATSLTAERKANEDLFEGEKSPTTPIAAIKKKMTVTVDSEARHQSPPQSPTKRGFRSMLSKINPVHKLHKHEPGSFKATTSSSKAEDKAKATETTTEHQTRAPAVLATSSEQTTDDHESSPSISSLEDSDVEEPPREKVGDVSDVSDDEFEEARNSFAPLPHSAFESAKNDTRGINSKFHEEGV